jgi:hypothetical protein
MGNEFDGDDYVDDGVPSYDEYEGNVYGIPPTGISRTKTQSVFPYQEVHQEKKKMRYLPLPTAHSLRNTSLFGIPLRSSLTGQEIHDDMLTQYIQEAISQIEHDLTLYITPVTFQERHDYSRHQFFWSFGYFKVNQSPILDVQKFQLTFNNGLTGPAHVPLVDLPLEFIHIQPQEGTVQLVPAQGVTISGLIVSIYSGLGFHAFNNQALSSWPGAILIEYRSGFETHKVPALLVSLIENMAAYKVLSIMGPILFPYNSTSIGIDGTSQSVGTMGPQFLKQRLDDLEKQIEKQLDTARGYYQKKFLVEYL